jgi:hypothetical protein
MKKRISYYSDGLKLSGILAIPDSGKGPFPGVVLVPGFMSTADAPISKPVSKSQFALNWGR